MKQSPICRNHTVWVWDLTIFQFLVPHIPSVAGIVFDGFFPFYIYIYKYVGMCIHSITHKIKWLYW